MYTGGEISTTKAKRPFRGNKVAGTVVARGCGKVLSNRRKKQRISSMKKMKKKGYAKGGVTKKKMGGAMKKKGFAKGGVAKRSMGGAMMKKKGYAKGGAAKMKRGGAAKKK